MIEKRARKGEADPDEQEELWKESLRGHHERARKENQARWYAFHLDMCELHARLSRDHEQRVVSVLGIDSTRTAGPARGDVEQLLGYLTSVERQFAEPAPEPAPEDAA